MRDPNPVNYGVYLASTEQGEICSVNVRPELLTPYQRRAAKLALENADPALGTPQQGFEGSESNGIVWNAIAAIGETRYVQNNLTRDDLLRARDVVIDEMQRDGCSAIPVGDIIITKNGLL